MGSCVSSRLHKRHRYSKGNKQQPWSVRTSTAAHISNRTGKFQTLFTAKNAWLARNDKHDDGDLQIHDSKDETGPWTKRIRRNTQHGTANLEIVNKETVLDKESSPTHKAEFNTYSKDEADCSDHYDNIGEDPLYEWHMDVPIVNDQHNSPKPPTVGSVYEENIKIFRPLIVRNVMVRDILPYLPFLEDHDEIYAVVARSPKEAMCILLEEIFKSPVVNKWDIFLDGLFQSGYQYIEQNIRGYSLIDHTYQEEYLKTLIPKLSKQLDVRDVIDHLCAADLLSDTDRQEIDREELNRGKIAAAILLLARITKKHSHWYIKFIDVLKETGNEHLAEDLEIPEMLEIEVHKQSNTNRVDASNQYFLPPPRKCYRRLPLPPSAAKPFAVEQFVSCTFTHTPDSPSAPPPLPPRVPIIYSKENNTDLLCGEYALPDTPRVRVPSRLNPSPPPSSIYKYETYSATSESHRPVRTVVGVGEIYDDFNEYEMYSFVPQFINDDGQNKNKDDTLIMPRNVSNTDLNIDKLPRLKYLFDEIINLQNEQSELNFAIKLKQKRNTIQETMMNDLQINRSLDLENETRRKDIEALRSGNVSPKNTSDASYLHALINTNHTKVTLDLREDVLQSLPYIPSLQMERFLSDSSDVMVKLYDPQSFHRIKSRISDRDSAIYFGNYA